MWLHSRPGLTRTVVFRLPDQRRLPETVDAARQLLHAHRAASP
ncbi:hypothetical protein AB0B40_33675 [Streptomyces sp. NPDC042638]